MSDTIILSPFLSLSLLSEYFGLFFVQLKYIGNIIFASAATILFTAGVEVYLGKKFIPFSSPITSVVEKIN